MSGSGGCGELLIKMADVILGSPPLELEVGGRDCIDSDIGEDACEGGVRLDDGVIAKASVDGVDTMFCSTTADGFSSQLTGPMAGLDHGSAQKLFVTNHTNYS